MRRGWLHELERMFREGQLPDPRTLPGVIVYTILGLGIGMLIANLMVTLGG